MRVVNEAAPIRLQEDERLSTEAPRDAGGEGNELTDRLTELESDRNPTVPHTTDWARPLAGEHARRLANPLFRRARAVANSNVTAAPYNHGDFLRLARKFRPMTTATLAQEIGLSPSTLRGSRRRGEGPRWIGRAGAICATRSSTSRTGSKRARLPFRCRRAGQESEALSHRPRDAFGRDRHTGGTASVLASPGHGTEVGAPGPPPPLSSHRRGMLACGSGRTLPRAGVHGPLVGSRFRRASVGGAVRSRFAADRPAKPPIGDVAPRVERNLTSDAFAFEK